MVQEAHGLFFHFAMKRTKKASKIKLSHDKVFLMLMSSPSLKFKTSREWKTKTQTTGKFNKWKKNYLQLCTQLNFSAKFLQNFLPCKYFSGRVCCREISVFLTQKLTFGASQCASGSLLCNSEGWWVPARGGKGKEIKKLWNLSENLFSSKFNAWKFC